ncbi:MAG: phosphocholine cytidylyltransferase family protein [Candidatus Cloacimonetes bacterium]|nr:phosphocholine cytidylyltransferase family protein [Candidatus Cloacimonadota bacterium]
MQAIILAAGMGRRLNSLTGGLPKPMLKITDKSVIHYQIEKCLQNGVMHFVIVIGYRQAEMKEHVLEILSPEQVIFVINPDFAVTNTLYSLFLAREFLDKDTLYFNGDVLFEEKLLPMLLDNPVSSILVEMKVCGAEEVKVIINEAGYVTAIGKELSLEECAGEFIGIACFRKEVLGRMVKFLELGVEAQQHNNYFEYAVNKFCGGIEIMAISTGDAAVIEIDFPEDLKRAKALFSK